MQSNKLSVTPQPSTKHLTDEELKLQYGIHMTSRIQEDGDGKEAKWADIDDDDEDDWAPTTIEWTDGTKSTVASTDVAKTIEERPQLVAASIDGQRLVQPARALAPQFPTSIGPNATVLKVGGNVEKLQAQRTSMQQLKGPNEKPTSMSIKTAPAPAPNKSPWAALPPVEKASPVIINPQPVPLSQKFPGSFGYSQSPSTVSGASPAKEISADDFSRTWRETPGGHARELYMPSSGKYEAVPEPRRRMSRNDGFRNATVLQRPNQSDAHAPAEPSAAFQTTRTSTDQVRRRASSTLSGGSGQFARRMSMSKQSETSAVIVDGPPLRSDVAPPDTSNESALQHQQNIFQAEGSVAQVQESRRTSQPTEEVQFVANQRYLMKERIEQARRRKQEEEAREEAAKQERIRQKLASLPPPSEIRKESKVENAAPTQQSALASQSPPKPPQPRPTGEPLQYGMMKVHPLDSVKKHGLPPATVESLEFSQTSTELQPTSQQHPNVPSPVVNGVRPVLESQKVSVPEPGFVSDRSPQPSTAVSVGADARAGWADIKNDRGAQPSSVWGLPNNKALGNGTFGQALTGFAPQDLSRANNFTGQGWLHGKPSSERSPQLPFVNTNPQENRQSLPAQTVPSEQFSLAANSEIDSAMPISKPLPIGPPQQHSAPHSWQASPNLAPPNGGLAAWNNFHQFASQQERAETERLQRELAARREEELRTGVKSGPQYSFNETWKQVQLGDQAGQRQIAVVTQSTTPASNLFGAVGSKSDLDSNYKMVNTLPSRGSRFFPQASDAPFAQMRRAVTHGQIERSGSPSPPPAEEYGSHHPAFEGDSKNPVVHFPREKAVVKLPPITAPPSATAVQEPTSPLSWAALASQTSTHPAHRSVSTPIVQTASWQARFDGLLRKHSPTKPAFAEPIPASVAVASRELFDASPDMPLVAVSLPQASGDLDSEKVTSKDVEDEEDLFEDREAGSLPAINLPRDMAPTTFPHMHPLHGQQFLKVPVPAETTSVRPFWVNNWVEYSSKRQDQFALVHLPGSTKTTKRTLRPPFTARFRGGRPRQIPAH